MKRVLLLTIFTSLVSSFSFSQCGGFYDGFESGSISPTWTNLGGLATNVGTSPVVVGNYALSISGGTGHLNGISATFPAITPPEISWYIYPNGNVANNYLVAGDATISATNCIMFAYWQGTTGNIRFVSNTSIDYPAVQNQWYHIEMKNINFVTRTFDLFINSALVASAFPFRSSTISDMTVMHAYNFAGGTAYYDEVIAGSTPISFDLAGTDILCNGDMNGAIDATVYNAQGPVNFAWSNAASTEDISGLGAGTYTLTATDSVGCVAVDSLMISEPSALAASYDTVHPTTCQGNDGSIEVLVIGGVPGYNHLWNTGDTGTMLSGLTAGNYEITVSDANGCDATWFFTLEDPEPPAVSIAWSTQNTCTYYAPFALTGGMPAGGTWSGLGVSGNNFNPASAGIGTNVLTYTYTDSLNCSASSIGEIYVDQCLGLEEANEMQVSVFPNPTHDALHIGVNEGSYSVRLLNLTGQEVANARFTGAAHQLGLSALAPGVYHLELIGETQRAVVSVVVE